MLALEVLLAQPRLEAVQRKLLVSRSVPFKPNSTPRFVISPTFSSWVFKKPSEGG